MAQTTAPVLVAGGLYAFDSAVLKKQGIPWKPLLATGIAVLMFAGAEKVAPKPALWLSYLVLVGELVTSDIVVDFAGWVSSGFPTSAGSGQITKTNPNVFAQAGAGAPGVLQNAGGITLKPGQTLNYGGVTYVQR